MQKDDLDFIEEIIKIAVPTVGAIIAVAGFWGQRAQRRQCSGHVLLQTYRNSIVAVLC